MSAFHFACAGRQGVHLFCGLRRATRAWKARLRMGPVRVALNSAWLLAARLGVQGVGVLLILAVARTLGAAGFGQYSYAAAVVFIANVVTSFGTDTLLVRAVAYARRAGAPLVAAALWLQTLLSAVAVLAIYAWTLLPAPRSPDLALALRVYALALFPLAPFSVLTALMRGFERMDLYFACSLIAAAAQAAAAWLALQAGGGLAALAAALVTAQVVAAACALWVCAAYLPRLPLRLRPDRRLLLHLVRRAWPLALVGILGVVYQRLGVLALSTLSDDAQAGLYAAAWRVIEALKFGHIAALGALLPAFARYARTGGGAERRGALRAALCALAVLAALEAAAAVWLAAPLVGVLYGAGFAPSAQAVRILALTLVPYSFSAVMSTWLVACGRERQVLAGLATGLAALLVLSLWLIPPYAAAGASLAALGGESAQALALWRVSRAQAFQPDGDPAVEAKVGERTARFI